MLSVFKILFLSISILFSFGFTINESKCLNVKKTQKELHSCCKKTPIEEETPCDGNCCNFPIAYYSFSEFELNNFSKKETSKIIIKIDFKLISSLIIPTEKEIFHPIVNLEFKQKYPDISVYQSWLI